MKLPILFTAALLVAATPAFAAEIHVAVTGADTAEGTVAAPLKTISAAALKAMPGDTVTVHAGVYRERVNPPRGGESDTKRIVYQAAPGEKVTITGSDEAKGWEKVSGDTWKLTLPNKSFGHFNPYADVIRGDWFDPIHRVHHTGCVYLNGEWLVEALNLAQVTKPAAKNTPGLWFATVDGDDGTNLLNLAKVKTSGGAAVSGGEPSFRYGGKPAPCSEGGVCSGFIQNGHWLRFDGIDFGSGSDSVELRAAALAGAGGIAELRLDTPEGELLGSCEIPSTGGWQKWQNFTAKIKPVSGKRILCVLFKTAKIDAGNTVIFAQFPGVNPNVAPVEINRRQTVFYPSKNFINNITVRGFTLRNAATNWAPPSSEQTAVVGTNWSKGWIIEDNDIGYSKCSGVSLGKYGDGLDNTNDAGAADPYTRCVRDALKNGWNKATIGSHIVRKNRIHHCEQTGVVGSMGCAFSAVTGNDIHDINSRRMFSGAEQAGIKFHGFVDGVIAGNHIYRSGNFGIWLDWMCQGSQVTGNLFHDNHHAPDIFCEMQHGPMVIANNLLLSDRSFWFNSKGIAVAHNLLSGSFDSTAFDGRNTPFHPAHATDIAGLHTAPAGDHRFYNNLAVRGFNGAAANNAKLPCFGAGSVFTGKSTASKFETDTLVKPAFDAKVKLTQKADGWYLTLAEDTAWKTAVKRPLVTTKLLGLAKIPNLPYENADGSPLILDTDYFGKKRDAANPFPGPFETPVNGEVKVWPKQ
jgi:alpha-N-arabinofuranosidase